MARFVLFAALLVVMAVATAPNRPNLPFAFQCDVTITLPFVGAQQGILYYDWTQQAERIDFNQFGATNTELQLYEKGIMTEYDASCFGGQCQCKTKPLTQPMSPMQIPPFAVWQGNTTDQDGNNLEVWGLDWFGTNLTWYVDADTNPKSPVATAFITALPGISPTVFNFTNYTIGPQSTATFNPVNFGCTSPTPPDYYQVSGYVIECVFGAPIPGVTVSLGSMTTTSGVDGMFTFNNVSAGVYTLEGSLFGWISTTKTMNVTGNIYQGTSADIIMSEPIPPLAVRFVLTWGAYPRDLDAHLLFPNGCNVNPVNTACLGGLNASAIMTHDAVNGYGPDTITLFFFGSGTYRHYVVINGEGSYAGSNANLIAYTLSGIAAQVNVEQAAGNPSQGVWVTVTVGNQQIKDVNVIQGSPPS